MSGAYQLGQEAALLKLGMVTRGQAMVKAVRGAGQAMDHLLAPAKAVVGATTDAARGVKNFFTRDVWDAFKLSPGMAAKEVALPALKDGANLLAGKYGPSIAQGLNTWAMPG